MVGRAKPPQEETPDVGAGKQGFWGKGLQGLMPGDLTLLLRAPGVICTPI